jgi:hypothetical protein
MKKITFILSLVFMITFVLTAAPAMAADKPNIVVIMGDDIGITNISAYSEGLMGYTMAGEGRRLGLFVHHTDGKREFAYDRKSHVGTLDKALDQAASNGWIIVDMKKDWKQIFPSK